MPQRPLISVIMPVYNGMPYLKQAVKSILEQSYKNFELIIVDDKSTDGTYLFLKKIKDKRVKILSNSKNLGIARSLNRAINNSRGQYIARMDADDISVGNRLDVQLKFLQDDSSIGICGSFAYLINEKGATIGSKKFPSKDHEIKKALNFYSPIIHPTFFAKASFFKKLSGYNPDFDYAEDYELLMRAANTYKMANVPEYLLLWRLWGKRRSRLNMKKMDQLDLTIKWQNFKRNSNLLTLAILIRKALFTVFIPTNIKVKFSQILNKS
jgi:glycosyltransferase involved in cell wall biosynthesis